MPQRRTQLADAALAVVAQTGLKGLTHRAVDAAAAVAEGTTSNYFRSRAALVDAVADRLEQLDVELLQSASPAGPPANVSEVAEQVTGLIFALMEQHAALTRARLAMSLDRPESVAGGHFRLLAGLEQTLAGLGIPDAPVRARDVADYSDGLLLHHLTARRTEDPDPVSTAAAIRRLLAN